MKTPLVLTVKQLNSYIKSVIEFDPKLSSVYVCAEISNFTNHYRTGHLYFSLKDEDSLIRAVMFRSNAQRLRFEPRDGMKVLVRGRISVYERDGQYQLYVDDMQPDGVGALQQAYEQLKERLNNEGLFDPKYKKPIPKYPSVIGVVTSPTGAAVHDIMNILSRRWPLAKMVLFPVQVQGDSAAPQIVNAIEKFNENNAADVLIVGRGGGSLEDLWAFNEETVARAVFNSKIPIISAVGHETDFTICDFTADLRAPTPSAAAELCTPDIGEQIMSLEHIRYMLSKFLNEKMRSERNRLSILTSNPIFLNPYRLTESYKQETDNLIMHMDYAMNNIVQKNKIRLQSTIEKLDALSPLKVLSRGYTVAFKNDKPVVKAESLNSGDTVNLRFTDGIVTCSVLSSEISEETL